MPTGNLSKTRSGWHNFYWLLLSLLTIILDQISKYELKQALPLYDERPLLPHLNLIHVHNTGAAFSMLRQLPPSGFVLLSLGVCAAIVFWLWRHPRGERHVAAGLALILGGALGNAVDRVMQGYVVDFVDFYIGDWHFAAFNLADSAITLGAGLLLLDLFLSRRG